jgi:hypothetical protein
MNSRIVFDIVINLLCILVGAVVTLKLHTRFKIDSNVSTCVGLAVGCLSIYLTGIGMHVSFYISLLGHGTPWQKTYRFFLFAIFSALLAVVFWLKARKSKSVPPV